MSQGGRARAGERDSSALTIGQLSAAQAAAVCCTICSSCTRVAAACLRASPFQNLQLEHGQHYGNGLRSRTQTRKHGATVEPDPNGRRVRKLQPRHSTDLRGIVRKPQTWWSQGWTTSASARAPRPARARASAKDAVRVRAAAAHGSVEPPLAGAGGASEGRC